MSKRGVRTSAIADRTAELFRPGHEREDLEQWRANPELFAIELFGIDVWRDYPDECQDQIQLLRSIFFNRRTACKSGHKTGKTFTLAVATLLWLTLYPDSKVVSMAPTTRQVKELLWQEIARLHTQAALRGYPIGGTPLQMSLSLGPNHKAIGFSTDDSSEGVQIQGWSGEYLLYLFDEAAGIPRVNWEVADTGMQSATAHICAAGNPSDPASPFYEACCNSRWHNMTLSSWNSPNGRAGKIIIPGAATHEWCQDKLEELGEEDGQYQFRVLGEFPLQSAFCFISLGTCQAAQDREPAHGNSMIRKVAGVDIARYGDDDTVITVMATNGEILRQIRLRKSGTLEVSRICMELYHREDMAAMAVDYNGVGGGVTDILLAQHGMNILPCNARLRASDFHKYGDWATEQFAILAQQLKDGLISRLPRTDIVRQLTNRRYEVPPKDGHQRMFLESKAAFKKRVAGSPDEADSLMLANFAKNMVNMGVVFGATNGPREELALTDPCESQHDCYAQMA